MSEVQLFACAMAQGRPSGVVTMSISRYSFASGFSRTTIAKALVPAETLPVRTPTEFVAVMPVPASPSGGQKGTPASRVPVGSRNAAPAAVRTPAASPAQRTLGRTSFAVQENFRSAIFFSNFSIMPASYCFVSESIGNTPEASPTPSTFSPVSFQCTKPARVVTKRMLSTWGSPFRIA